MPFILRSLCCGAGLFVFLFFLSAPNLVLAPVPDPEHPAFDRPDLALTAALDHAEELPRLYSILVNWRGEMLLEEYFHGRTANSIANLKSASKSVLAAMIGIAVEHGVIPSVEEPISTWFPEIASDPERSSITVENLLMMRSGLRTTSNRFYGNWVSSSDWVRYALIRSPMQAKPGERMIYSTGNTHLLSALLTRAAKESTWEFGRENLAEPLGFDLLRWERDPQGVYFGGNDMLMTPRQMMAIGETYLHKGDYRGKRILSEDWVETSCAGPPRGGRRRSEQRYGYGWWGGEFDTFDVCYAWGYGGQFIFVMPELDLVVVTTSSPFDTPDRRGYNQRLFDVVEDYVVKPIADASEWDRLYAGESHASAEGRSATARSTALPGDRAE